MGFFSDLGEGLLSTVTGGLLGNFLSREQSYTNLHQQQRLMQEQTALNRETWNQQYGRMMSDQRYLMRISPSLQRSAMMQAGMTTNSMFGGFSPAVSSPSGSATGLGSVSIPSRGSSDLFDFARLRNETKIADATEENIQADTHLKNKQAGLVEAQAQYQITENEWQNKLHEVDVDLKKSQQSELKNKVDVGLKNMALMDKEMQKIDSTIRNLDEQTFGLAIDNYFKPSHLQAVIENLQSQTGYNYSQCRYLALVGPSIACANFASAENSYAQASLAGKEEELVSAKKALTESEKKQCDEVTNNWKIRNGHDALNFCLDLRFKPRERWKQYDELNYRTGTFVRSLEAGSTIMNSFSGVLKAASTIK